MSNGKKLKKGLTQYREEKAYTDSGKKVTGMIDENGPPVPPAKQKAMQSYVDTLMYALHHEDSADSVMEIMAADNPGKSVPNAALMVNEKVEKALKAKGQEVPKDVKMAGAAYLVDDLVQLGNASGMWGEQIGENDTGYLLQNTMQKYIETGFKDGSIDAVEFQKEIEPMLNEEQRAKGLAMQEKSGIPANPTETMAVNRIVDSKLSKEQEKTTKMKEKMTAMGNMAQAATGGGMPAPQDRAKAQVNQEGGRI